MHVTAVLNQKGGVGKTGLTAGVGGALAETGARVLLVDLDPQGHLTTEALGLAEADEPATVAAALAGHYTGPVAQLVAHHSKTDAGGVLDVLPTALAMFLVGRELDRLPAREWRLARLLEALADRYDRVVIDCPPALDVLTDNALAACHGVLIPVQPERSSVRALRLLLGQIEGLEAALRRERIVLHGLVPGLYRRPLSRLAAHVMGELDALPLPMLAHLPLAVVVGEAWDAGVPLTSYAPHSEHADAYRSVAATLQEQQS
ncbi:MAG: AAA family ATPase [Pseudonocardiaceae bacterium]|nr:AAA family ATPase [Pseudonocardiaceae bacterium]